MEHDNITDINTYPRTESRHLSNDMLPELPNILRALPSEWPIQTALTALTTGLKLSKAYVDDTKLTDHHAIIPTHKQAAADFPKKHRYVYELVAARFLGIFFPPEVRDETTVTIQIGHHSFRTLGSATKEPGWTTVGVGTTSDEEKAAEDDHQKLPALSQGQTVAKRSAQLSAGKTTAPKPYDDSSLLTAMKNAGQEIDDKDLATAMKQNGLGTPATRAAIIEKLTTVGYVERKKKSLQPTAKGKALIIQVHQTLKDVSLTASWEQQLSEIQDGTHPADMFAAGIVQFIREIFAQIIASPPTPIAQADQNTYGLCPKCKQGFIRKTKLGAGCSRFKEGCTFSIWSEVCGKKLSGEHIRQLVTNGRTGLIKGFMKKDGNNTYDACLVLMDFKIRLEFDGHAKAAKTGQQPII